MARIAPPLIAAATAFLGVVLLESCGSGITCGLGLAQWIDFPKETDAVGEVACCGGATYQDLNLAADNVQVDLINSSSPEGRVDFFLASGDCARLFNGSYEGTITSPLCAIYIGPVKARVTSQRTAIRRGRYRMFAQAYTSNASPAQFLMQIGLWSDACHWNPISP